MVSGMLIAQCESSGSTAPYFANTIASGNVVQAHTNLTEIKLAAELLWRVDIPPEKVVMGVGFYGRSFQLADPSCDKPGCKFKGTAEPGACTKTGGILAYFGLSLCK